MEINEITEQIIKAAIAVHRELRAWVAGIGVPSMHVC